MAIALPADALNCTPGRELPDALWRGSCIVAGQGNEEQSEWLHDMAVTLLDINELPTFVPQAAAVRQSLDTPTQWGVVESDPDSYIPF